MRLPVSSRMLVSGLFLSGLLACASGEAPCLKGACVEGSADSSADTSPEPTGDSSGGGETSPPDDTQETGDSGDAPPLPPEPLPLCINELMIENGGTLTSDAGEPSDWIELHNPTDTDVSVAGWSFTDDREDPTRSVLPEGSVVPAGGFVLFFADGDPLLGPRHLAFKLDDEDGEVGLFADDGRGTIIEFGTISKDMAAARATDCCEGEGCWGIVYAGTPEYTNEPPPVIEGEEVVFVPPRSTWSYWDQAGSPGEDWASTSFDSSSWATGIAPLGYGDSHIVTTVSSSEGQYTVYFRLTFTAAEVSTLTDLTASILRDDGAVVYLNGVEIARSNMAPGATTYDMLANETVGNETVYARFVVSPSLLVEGTNVLAAEIHQGSVDSADLGFDLSLIGARPTGE